MKKTILGLAIALMAFGGAISTNAKDKKNKDVTCTEQTCDKNKKDCKKECKGDKKCKEACKAECNGQCPDDCKNKANCKGDKKQCKGDKKQCKGDKKGKGRGASCPALRGIELSTEQASKITTIQDNSRKELDAIRETERENSKAVMDKANAQIREVLTPEQQTVFDANVQKMSQRPDLKMERKGGQAPCRQLNGDQCVQKAEISK